MNTEMKVRDHDNFMSVHDIYTRAYNAGKTDVIKVFVERIKKDIEAFVGEDDEFVKDLKARLYKILDDRKEEVIE